MGNKNENEWSLEEKIAWAQGEAKKEGATFVNAIFKTLGEIADVTVKIPGSRDNHFKLVGEHKLMVPINENFSEFVPVVLTSRDKNGALQACYRRGDFIPGEKGKMMLTRSFFIKPGSAKEKINKITATVRIKEKTDFYRNGEKTLILEILEQLPNGSPLVPSYVLRLTVDHQKGVPNMFKIPETEKAVFFEKIK